MDEGVRGIVAGRIKSPLGAATETPATGGRGAKKMRLLGAKTRMKPQQVKLSLGEDDIKTLKDMGVAVDPEDHWAARMAEAIAQGKNAFVNPRTGKLTVRK